MILIVTAYFPLIFVSNLFITFEIKLISNWGKLSLAKGIVTLVSASLPKLASQKPKYQSDWVILDIWALLISFIYWHIISKDISYLSCLSCC